MLARANVWQHRRRPRATAAKPYTSNVPKRRSTNREVEIKLKIDDVGALRRKLTQIGAKFHRRVLEQNTLYDTLDSAMRRSGRLLRLRIETPVSLARRPNGAIRAVLTSKSPVAQTNAASRTQRSKPRYKERYERELVVQQPLRIMHSMKLLGFRGRFRYEKYRTTYLLPGLHLDLDETPVGAYLELEGTPQAIESAARRLGFAPADYRKETYWDVYAADCKRRGVRPSNMLFR
jgi:adenylate cyclase, class 2